MKRVGFLFALAMAFSLLTPRIAKARNLTKTSFVNQQKEVKYEAIKAEDLPDAVTKSFTSDYSSYKIDKAFKGDDGTYKLNVSNGNLKYVLFYNADGKLLKVEKPDSDS